MKKFIIGLLSVIVLISSSVVCASDTIQAYLFPVKYVINGQIKELNSEYTTLNYNGHAYVPLRFFAESLGAKVNYHENETAITINTPFQEIPTKYDKNAACRNGDFVYESHLRMEKNCNLEAFVAFLSNTTKLQKDWVRIIRYTVEGDPMVQQLDFDGKQILYTLDTTRDKFGERAINQTMYSKITTTKFIYDNVEYTEFFLTGTEPNSEQRKLFSLNSQIVADVGKDLDMDAEIKTDKEAVIDDWQFDTTVNAYTVQAYLFPAIFEFNGVSKEVNSSEYVVLNYQGHAYVPIRFVAENMGILVKYEESTKTIFLNETSLDNKLQLNEAFLSAVAQGKLPGIEFGIGAAKKDVFEAWGEPHRTGSRHGRYDAWFDYNYYFSGPNQTVGAIGVSGDTIHYTIDQVKKALGQPNYEGLSLVENGWEMSYAVGTYVLFFSADKKDGTIYYMTFMKQNENTEATNYNFSTWNEKKLYDFFYEILEYTNQISMKIYPTKEEIITKYQAYFTSELSVKIVDSLFVKTNEGWRVPDGDGGYI
ncbi:MAG: copper amine oxidase-like protein, partial [Paenibacillus sp.]|nr:copper amine oxidase-like protein [Paenibacillus sp.]